MPATDTRKEGRKVLTEGWRKGVPINNTPRRGATVATPITPIVAHTYLYIRIHVRTVLRLAFETSSSSKRKKITRGSFSFSLSFSLSFRGNCPWHGGESRKRRRFEVEGRMNLLTILRSMRVSSQFLGDHFELLRERASEHVFENSRLRSLLKFHATWSFTLFLGKIYRFERGEDGDTRPTAGTETNEGIKTVVENVESYYSAKDFEVKSSFVYKLDYDEQSKIYRNNNKKENVNKVT